MQSEWLDRAVAFHGEELLKQLEREQNEDVWKNLKKPDYSLTASQSRIENEESLHLKICKFIAQKADMLFKRNEPEVVCLSSQLEEGHFAIMPPLEMFMDIDELSRRKHFFATIAKGDVVCGKISGKLDSGYLVTLLCFDNSKSRFISDLNIKAFCPLKEVALLSVHEDPIDMYLIKDLVRGIVLAVCEETERITISLKTEALPADSLQILRLGLINEDDLPKAYRMSNDDITNQPFSLILQQQHGFNNPSNLTSLCSMLRINQDKHLSFMRALHGVTYPETELAVALRKAQSAKSAFKSVADGVTHFKAGRYLEALQHLNKALQIDPDNVEALVARGALYANNNSFLRAIENFEQALQISPQHANARKYLSETLTAQAKELEEEGEKESAIGLYQRALCINPFLSEAKSSYEALQQQLKQLRECKVPDKVPTLDSSDVKLLKLQSSKEKLKQLLKREKKEKQKKKEEKSQIDSKIRSQSRFKSLDDDKFSEEDSESSSDSGTQSSSTTSSSSDSTFKRQSSSGKNSSESNVSHIKTKSSRKRSPSVKLIGSDSHQEGKKFADFSNLNTKGSCKYSALEQLSEHQKTHQRRSSYSPKSNLRKDKSVYYQKSIHNNPYFKSKQKNKEKSRGQHSTEEMSPKEGKMYHSNSFLLYKLKDSPSDNGSMQKFRHSTSPTVRLLDTSYYEDLDKDDRVQKVSTPPEVQFLASTSKQWSTLDKSFHSKTSDNKNYSRDIKRSQHFSSSSKDSFEKRSEKSQSPHLKSFSKFRLYSKSRRSSSSPEVLFIKEEKGRERINKLAHEKRKNEMHHIKGSPDGKRKPSSNSSRSSEDYSSHFPKKDRQSYDDKEQIVLSESYSENSDKLPKADFSEKEKTETLADMEKFLEMLRSKKKSQVPANNKDNK